MAEYDLISKTALLEHLDMAMECENCPRNADKELYKCVHNPTPERCTCSDIAQICIRITEFATFADVQPVNQWISVKDRLPDTVDDCLVWYSCDTAFGKSKSVGISFCSRDDWYKKHLNGDNIVVLYWMPLPEPPKDGDTE